MATKRELSSGLTADRLRRLFTYDEFTGILRWKNPIANCVKPGAVAGYPEGRHRRVYVDGNRYQEHRVIWFFQTGAWPKNEIDHVDQNGLNNCLNNLRQATRGENNANRGVSRKNTSGVSGVHFSKTHNCWIARIRSGTFHFEASRVKYSDAVTWRKQKETEILGQFAPEERT